MQQYIRIFIPLVNESRGYEHKGRNPAGRCLLESRAGLGKLIMWVQDLRPEALYRVHLIFRDGESYAGLPLCAMSLEANGKAELRHSFDATNIEGYGLSLEECVAVALIAAGGHDTAAPLCGYREGEISWRKGYKKLSKENPADKSNKTPPEEPEEEPPEPQENNPPEPPDEEDDFAPLTPDPENALSDHFKNQVEQILKSHTHMHPFQKQSRHVEWVRISLDEDLQLPNYICDLLNEPFVETAYAQYSHLILGKATDEGPKRYYIGIPALYEPKDKIIGFRQFKCSEDSEPKPGDYGYWLIFMS